MLTSLKTYAALALSVWGAGCMQTYEEDYGLDLASSCDDRLNRPVLSASSNGSYSAAPVNTQTIKCAGTNRTFEIISERTGG
jgi:hypothetical protein